ncbi:MAG: hypothetical protein Q4G05_03070 [Clostridia bacterium]|nr:hypothetical protein [Clostridia bacterium]
MKDFINIKNNLFAVNILENGDSACIKPEGKMINSNNLDKADITQAREYI